MDHSKTLDPLEDPGIATETLRRTSFQLSTVGGAAPSNRRTAAVRDERGGSALRARQRGGAPAGTGG